jgi:hypothetical protein
VTGYLVQQREEATERVIARSKAGAYTSKSSNIETGLQCCWRCRSQLLLWQSLEMVNGYTILKPKSLLTMD